MRSRLDVKVGQKDDIISVSFKSVNPDNAALIVNAIVESYIDYHTNSKRSTSTELLKTLQTEREKRDAELSAKLRGMVNLKQNNEELAFENENGSVILTELARLSEKLIDANQVALDAQTTYETLRSIISDPIQMRLYVVESQDSADADYQFSQQEVIILRDRLGRLEGKQSDLRMHYYSNHPDVTTLEAEIDDVRNKIAALDEQFARSQVEIARHKNIAAKNKFELLTEQYALKRQEVLKLNDQLAQYAVLQHEYDRAKSQCDILDDRIKELNVAENATALYISVLEQARPTVLPCEPQKKRTIIIALAMGMVLGCGLALARDLTDQRLRSSSEVAATLSAPALGSIPSMPRRQRIERVGHKALLLGLDSPVIEAYRALRTTLLYSMSDINAKTVLVTSPQTNEGKTSFVSNLAVSLAQAGRAVIVLDADFRRPRQHRIFGISNKTGLSETISGTVDLGQAIQSIQSKSIKHLDVLTAGRSVSHSAEAFGSRRFAQILENLSTLPYDHIIIDAPPVIPLADARVLAAVSDTIILVVRANRTTLMDVQQARNVLAGIGANILGAVINDVPRGKTQYGCCYNDYGYRGVRAKPVYRVQGRKRHISDTQSPISIDEIRVPSMRQRKARKTTVGWSER